MNHGQSEILSGTNIGWGINRLLNILAIVMQKELVCAVVAG